MPIICRVDELTQVAVPLGCFMMRYPEWPESSTSTHEVCLEGAGWQDIPIQSIAARGFVRQAPEQTVRLCYAERKLVMQVTFSEDNLAYITINQQRNPCSDPHRAHMRVQKMLPPLRPPQDIVI